MILKSAAISQARTAAIYALGNRGDADALDLLGDVAFNSQDFQLSKAAVYAIFILSNLSFF